MAEDYSHFRSDAELRTGVMLWQVFSPVLLVFGTIGNVLSIIVLSRPRFNRWSSTVFLIGLAGADLAVLYVGLLRQWIKYMFDADIRHVNGFFCKLHWWLMYTVADCSVWILTAITIERLISALCPYKSKKICTKHIAKIVLVAVVSSSLLINCHLLFGWDRLEIQDGNSTLIIPCAPVSESYDHFFGKVWTWIDLCKFSLVPFAILTTGNICIIYRLIASQHKVKTQIAPSTAQTMATTSQGNQKTSNMSVLLVALNFVFIACTSPVCVYFIGEPYWIPKDVPRPIQLQDPWWAFVNLLMYLNNSSNFILYCLTGSRFRSSVRNLFSCRKSSQTAATTSAVGTTLNNTPNI